MNDFQRYLAEEFAEDYYEGRISRRKALELIASVTGNLVAAASVLAACAPAAQESPTPMPVTGQANTPTLEPAAPTAATQAAVAETPAAATAPPDPETAAPTVNPEDLQVEADLVDFPDGETPLKAYLARPTEDGSFPVILVCHENRGLTEHIQDVARRLAKAGYVALAVDLLSRQGGTPAFSTDQVPGVLGNIPPEQFVQDFLSGWRYLQTLPFADAGRVGMVGFCFGGGVTWRMATQMPELKAAVPFYGPHPPVEDVPNIQAAVLAIYAERDQRINQGIPAIEEAMQQHDKVFEKVIYPNADHAFHNDTGTRYDPQAAQDAWQRTLAWFGRYV